MVVVPDASGVRVGLALFVSIRVQGLLSRWSFLPGSVGSKTCTLPTRSSATVHARRSIVRQACDLASNRQEPSFGVQ